MTEFEIYDLLYSNSWQCLDIKETICFRPNDSVGFYTIKILNGIEVSRYSFERTEYNMTKEELESPNIKHLLFFTGLKEHYIKVISDERIKVFLPGIDHLELSKVENEIK